MAAPTITHADGACAIGTVANVCAVYWSGESTLPRNEAWVRAATELAARLATPIAVVSIVGENAPSPSSEIRAVQGRFLEDLSRTALAAGVVVDGSGFRASLVRAVVASVSALARYKCPFYVVSTDTEMARWLQDRSAILPQSAVRAVAPDLCALFAALRARTAR